MANIISSFSFNLVYPAAPGDPAYPVLLLSCLPGNIYAQRELLQDNLFAEISVARILFHFVIEVLYASQQ